MNLTEILCVENNTCIFSSKAEKKYLTLILVSLLQSHLISEKQSLLHSELNGSNMKVQNQRSILTWEKPHLD